MMPYVEVGPEHHVRLDVHYKRFLRNHLGTGIDAIGQPYRPDETQEKLRRELFGHQIISLAPPTWTNMQRLLYSEMTPREIKETDIHTLAKWFAARNIKSMVETLRRFREMGDRKTKGEASKPKANAPAKSPKLRRAKRSKGA